MNPETLVIRFKKNNKTIKTTTLGENLSHSGLTTRNIGLLKAILINEIEISPVDGDGAYSIGYLSYD